MAKTEIMVNCPDCGLDFAARGYVHHRRGRHENTPAKYECSECGRRFRFPGAHIRHSASHAQRREKFWQRVDKNSLNGCWVFTGKQRKGYGRVSFGRGRDVTAHAYAWSELRGIVPEGLELDHLCRNRICVNPDHLEPVTHEENMRRGLAARQDELCDLCDFVAFGRTGLAHHKLAKHPAGVVSAGADVPE